MCRCAYPPRAAAVENYCGPISSGLEKRWLRRIFGTPMPRWNRARFCCAIIGTSGIVYPAASFAPVAKSAGAYVIELNLETTPYTGVVDRSFQGRAKDLVPALLK